MGLLRYALIVLLLLPASAQGMTRSQRCHKHSVQTVASVFSDYKGNHDNVLGPNSYAELSNNYWASLGSLDFSAMGGQPHGRRADVWTPGHKVRRLYKGDVGAGGAGFKIGKKKIKRRIDLRPGTARKLGIDGLGLVRYSFNRCY